MKFTRNIHITLLLKSNQTAITLVINYPHRHTNDKWNLINIPASILLQRTTSITEAIVICFRHVPVYCFIFLREILDLFLCTKQQTIVFTTFSGQNVQLNCCQFISVSIVFKLVFLLWSMGFRPHFIAV